MTPLKRELVTCSSQEKGQAMPHRATREAPGGLGGGGRIGGDRGQSLYCSLHEKGQAGSAG